MHVRHTCTYNILILLSFAEGDDILATEPLDTALDSGDPCSSTDRRNNQPESDAGECYVITLFTKCLIVNVYTVISIHACTYNTYVLTI